MTELVLRNAGLALRTLRNADPIWLLVLAIPLVIAALDPVGAPGVIGVGVGALIQTAPYITLAVLLIGLLKAAGAEGVIAEAFQGAEVRMIILAALFGGLAPFCSCEVIPFVAALLAARTPLSAVMAFWLSSPLMDPPQFAITTGALGMEYAVAKTLVAVTMGLAGGFATMALVRGGAFADPLRVAETKSCCASSCGTGKLARPVWKFWPHPERRAAFRDAALTNAIFLLKWMSLAYLLETIMIHYVPAQWIAGFVGGEGAWPVVVGALVGAPAYLNGYAAPALVAGLMEQGMTPGAAMSFMVAGSVTSIPAMAAVFALVKRQVFLSYVGFGLSGAIVSGLIFGAVIG